MTPGGHHLERASRDPQRIYSNTTLSFAVRRHHFQATVNKAVEIIRHEGRISFGQLCLRLDLSPTYVTMIRQVMEDVFDDITYEDRCFVVHRIESIEEKATDPLKQT